MCKVCKAHYEEVFDTNSDVYLALLQIEPTPIGPVLPTPAALMFNRSVRGLMPKLSRPLCNVICLIILTHACIHIYYLHLC